MMRHEAGLHAPRAVGQAGERVAAEKVAGGTAMGGGGAPRPPTRLRAKDPRRREPRLSGPKASSGKPSRSEVGVGGAGGRRRGLPGCSRSRLMCRCAIQGFMGTL